MFNSVMRLAMQKYLQDYEISQLTQDWDKFFQQYTNHIHYYGYEIVSPETAYQVYVKGLSSDIRMAY